MCVYVCVYVSVCLNWLLLDKKVFSCLELYQLLYLQDVCRFLQIFHKNEINAVFTPIVQFANIKNTYGQILQDIKQSPTVT